MTSTESILLFGGNGWLGGKLTELARALPSATVVVATSRLEDRSGVAAELDRVKPTRVLNAAGVTGRPNVDWCEAHKEETIRVNVLGTLGLADLCDARGIHLTIYATGCIYEYDSQHAMRSGVGFTELDVPNFKGSFYSESKGYVDQLLKHYRNVLTLRVRMPLSDEYEHPRSFITKITHYQRVVDVPNSMTILDELLPISLDMSLKRVVGVYNFTNPGVISHNEVLSLYRELIHPDFKWTNFSVEEQAKILAAGRSNNELDVSKLLALYPAISEIKAGMRALFERMAKKMPADAKCPTH
jgi:dTDP-4-dehydrorhamnose reductase